MRVPVGGAQLALAARPVRRLPMLPVRAQTTAGCRVNVLAYECHGCHTRMGDDLPYCRTCGDDMLAVQAVTSQPEPSSDKQRITICVLFKALGEMHKDTRMRDLSRYTGRQVSDYGQLTAAEAVTATAKLRERNRGTRS